MSAKAAVQLPYVNQVLALPRNGVETSGGSFCACHVFAPLNLVRMAGGVWKAWTAMEIVDSTANVQVDLREPCARLRALWSLRPFLVSRLKMA